MIPWQWMPPANSQGWDVYSNKQTKKVLPRAKTGKQWKLLSPASHPTDHVSPAVGCDIVNTSDLKKVTTLYFWKSYHTFISLKNILSLLQVTRCLDFITGSKVATKENQNNLHCQHDLKWYKTDTELYSYAKNTTMLCIKHIVWTVTSKLRKTQKVQFSICFSMELTGSGDWD